MGNMFFVSKVFYQLRSKKLDLHKPLFLYLNIFIFFENI